MLITAGALLLCSHNPTHSKDWSRLHTPRQRFRANVRKLLSVDPSRMHDRYSFSLVQHIAEIRMHETPRSWPRQGKSTPYIILECFACSRTAGPYVLVLVPSTPYLGTTEGRPCTSHDSGGAKCNGVRQKIELESAPGSWRCPDRDEPCF